MSFYALVVTCEEDTGGGRQMSGCMQCWVLGFDLRVESDLRTHIRKAKLKAEGRGEGPFTLVLLPCIYLF